MGTLKKEIDLTIDPKHLSMVKEILKQFVFEKDVWAYGSRVKGTAKKHSDLDLVVFGLDSKNFSNLREAFDESNIPFRVDIMDWNKIPESFQKNITEEYIVIQEGKKEC